jgi:hypothetical protein
MVFLFMVRDAAGKIRKRGSYRQRLRALQHCGIAALRHCGIAALRQHRHPAKPIRSHLRR